MSGLLSAFVFLLGATVVSPAPAAGPVLVAADGPAPWCAAPIETARGGTDPDLTEQADCTAVCTEGPNVSCTNANQCTAVNQNCGAGQRGYVTCDGVTQYCTACPRECTFMQCRQGCYCPGGFSNCYDITTCSCECIYQ